MAQEIIYADSILPPPAKIYCVGIGGIGVSGLAQHLVHAGYSVAGSDRGLNDTGKEHLYDKLRKQGIHLYPQDGSGVLAEKPDMLLISTAVEPGNPDLTVMQNLPVIHRARALAQSLNHLGIPQITIAGSCGKTSVTGWIAATLKALRQRIVMINGGYTLGMESDCFPGNFYTDEKPQWAIVEVDESDRSISEFTPDYGILLNVGNDHYSQDELKQVFSAYLGKCKRGAILLRDLSTLATDLSVPVTCFDAGNAHDYTPCPDGLSFIHDVFGTIHSTQSGAHSVLNACAVLAVMQQLKLSVSPSDIAAAINAFKGIRQRFECVGKTSSGIPVINDYAHNPEKIAAAMSTARERFGSPLIALFQPHGFTPLRFMREPLVDTLKQKLLPEDKLILLPVFYAGGTAAFSPTSDEVASELQQAGLPAEALQRTDAESFIRHTTNASCILVMGARDASLRTWSINLTK